MKIKYITILTIACLYGQGIQAQYKVEREFRILKSQFPPNALALIDEHVEGARRLKFYKELDSTRISFEAKFKKDRLWYSVEFDADGTLEDIEILIKPADIPNESYSNIEAYLSENFLRYRIKRLQQQYPHTTDTVENTFKNAFQNLLLPTLNYEVVIAGKREDGYMDYEILFDADGNFQNIRTSLPPNYDHVLY